MGNAWLNLGVIQMTAKDYTQAGASFTEALRLATGPESWAARQNALKHLATIAIEHAQYAAALKLFDQCLALDRNLKRAEWESEIQSNRTEVLLAVGQIDQAMSAAVDATRLAREIGSPSLVYEALVARGRANSAKKLHLAARADFEEAVATAEAIRAEGLGDQQALRGGFQKKLPAYRLLANELIELQDPALALRTAEQAKARVLMDLLLDGPVDERKAMSAQELAQQKRLLLRVAVMNKAAARSPTPEAKQNADEAMREEERFRRDVFTRHPELHLQSGEFEVATPAELSALLPDDRTALLEYFQTSDISIALFVVRRGAAGRNPHVQVFTVPGNFELDARRFRQQLADRDLDYKTRARSLYDRLLAPARSALKDTDNLIVSPDGALWEIPFQALIDGAGRHLIETHRISLTPSLTALCEIHRRQARPWKFDLLALGNPSMAGLPLPDAAREVEEIRAMYPAGSVTRIGPAATVDEFRRSASFARIIHIAAHANLNDGDPLYSSLSLTASADARDDGLLTAREIMSMHLNAEMVILSACETGLGEARPGEGMMGMGWALSAAGASSAVLSEWKVDSAATRDFMVTLHQRLVAHRGAESRAESLRLTALRRMKAPGKRHPFYWAGFTLWGDGS
jgi:CHAT domain-containing protein